MKIKIYYDNLSYRLKGWKKIKGLIEKVIGKENMISGDLNFIITDDESLKKINIEFLKHYYYTDVITFNYNNNKVVNGEIYISYDRIKENSLTYKVSLRSEMLRVMIHGTLHLLGYNDSTDEERKEMKIMEDYWLIEEEKRRNEF